MVINSQKPKMQVVGMAGSLQEAMQAVSAHNPNLVLMDLDLGGANSLDFLPDFLEMTSAKVVVLTGILDPAVHESAIYKGARGVLLKCEPAKVIIKAIEKVHEGEIWASNIILGRVLDHISHPKSFGKQSNPENQQIAELTQREREIINALVALETSTNEEIADQLCISKSTLKNHLTTIYSKLNVKNRVQLMKYAITHKLAKPPQ